MEQKKRQDDMEEFFRKAFDELGDAPSDDGWDRPSPGVWAGIQAGLPVAPAKRLGWSWLWGMLLLLLLLPLGLLYWQNRGLEQRLEEQEGALQQMQASLDSLLIQRINPSPQAHLRPIKGGLGSHASLPDGIQESAQVPLQPLKGGLGSHASLPGQEIRESAQMPLQPLKGGLGSHALLPDQGTQESAQSVHFQPLKGELSPHGLLPAQGISPLAHLPMNTLAYRQITALQAGPALSLEPHQAVRAAAKPAFYLGGYTAYNHTSRVIGHKSNQPGRALFEVQENGQGSLEWGLRAGLQLSPRWAVESGLSAFSIRQESRQAFRVRYDPGRERPVGGGQLEATYALAIPSAYGTSELDVDLRRAASQPLLPGAYLALEVHAQQRLRFVSIPLTLHYRLLNRRFQLGLKGGLALSFLQSTSLQTTVQSRRAGLMVPDARVRERFAEVRSANLDYLLGLSAHYRLTPSLSLVLEPTYRKNLQPLTESPNFSSSAFAWGLQAGVNYRF